MMLPTVRACRQPRESVRGLKGLLSCIVEHGDAGVDGMEAVDGAEAEVGARAVAALAAKRDREKERAGQGVAVIHNEFPVFKIGEEVKPPGAVDMDVVLFDILVEVDDVFGGLLAAHSNIEDDAALVDFGMLRQHLGGAQQGRRVARRARRRASRRALR